MTRTTMNVSWSVHPDQSKVRTWAEVIAEYPARLKTLQDANAGEYPDPMTHIRPRDPVIA